MRTYHLIDIENLCGSGNPDTATAIGVLNDYLKASAWRSGDQVVVACNRRMASEFFYRLPPGLACQRRIGRPGGDGADRELLDAAELVDAPANFERIVLGSGDRFFVPLVARCRQNNTRLEVVLGEGMLSRRLGIRPWEVRQMARPRQGLGGARPSPLANSGRCVVERATAESTEQDTTEQDTTEQETT